MKLLIGLCLFMCGCWEGNELATVDESEDAGTPGDADLEGISLCDAVRSERLACSAAECPPAWQDCYLPTEQARECALGLHVGICWGMTEDMVLETLCPLVCLTAG